MSKKSSTPPLPALSVKHAHQLEAVESNFQRAIEHCFDYYGSIIHPVKADAYMRSYAVQFFSIYLAAYPSSSLPLWIPELKGKAIEWVLTSISNYSGVNQEQLREFMAILDETLDEHLKTFRSSPNPLLAALAPSALEAYAAAGVDIKSKAPLLQIAMAQGAQQVVASVPSQIVALKPAKISRSITSPSAARKLEQFISTSGQTLTQFAGKVNADERTIRRFRSTGTVDKTVLARIAGVMNTSVEKLLE